MKKILNKIKLSNAIFLIACLAVIWGLSISLITLVNGSKIPDVLYIIIMVIPIASLFSALVLFLVFLLRKQYKETMVFFSSSLVILVCSLFYTGFVFFGGLDYFTNRDKYIENSYKINENSSLIIDKWDCGATCDSNRTVYLKTKNFLGLSSEKALLSCEGIYTLELSDITATSAKIANIQGTKESLELCGKQDGDYIYYETK